MHRKLTLLLFDIFGGVLVSTGFFDLSAACGGFLVYLLNHPGNNLKCRLRLRCCRLIDGSYLLTGALPPVNEISFKVNCSYAAPGSIG